MTVAVRRVYESASRTDGARILVDRLWPRGLTKEKVAIEDWLRDLAPSDNLRKWFHTQPQRWADFRKRYLKELNAPEAEKDLQKLYSLTRKKKRVTLLFASRNEKHNNAVVLKELLDGMRKPPTGTGPGVLRAIRRWGCGSPAQIDWLPSFKIIAHASRLSVEPSFARPRTGQVHAHHGYRECHARFILGRRLTPRSRKRG